MVKYLEKFTKLKFLGDDALAETDLEFRAKSEGW